MCLFCSASPSENPPALFMGGSSSSVLPLKSSSLGLLNTTAKCIFSFTATILSEAFFLIPLLSVG